MGIANHDALVASAFTGFKMNFADGLAMIEPSSAAFSETIQSSTTIEDYGWLEEFPSMREWIGARQQKDMKAESYTLKNKKWEATVPIARERFEDDTFGVYSKVFEKMGRSARRQMDELMYPTLLAGVTELGYDGLTFFNDAHLMGAGAQATTFDNNRAGAGEDWFLMDTTQGMKPLIFQDRIKAELISKTSAQESDGVFETDTYRFGSRARNVGGYAFWQTALRSSDTLNAANFDIYIADMMAIIGDQNEKLVIRPNLLVCGPSNRAAALDLLGVDRLASGATNRNFQEVDLLITPYLT